MTCLKVLMPGFPATAGWFFPNRDCLSAGCTGTAGHLSLMKHKERDGGGNRLKEASRHVISQW